MQKMKRHKVIITERAQADARCAESFYNSLRPGLGKYFRQLFRSKIRDIAERPFTHAIRYKNIRFAQLDSFPYVIHYFIDEANPSVIVIALHHEKEAPERWLEYRA